MEVLNPKNGARYQGDFVVVDRRMHSMLDARSIQQMALMTIQHENISQLSQTTETRGGGRNTAIAVHTEV